VVSRKFRNAALIMKAKQAPLVTMDRESTYDMLQVVAANQVANTFAAFSLVGMVALQTSLGGAGKGQKADDGEEVELHCAWSGM
jgi:hypothetical protein